MAFEFLRPIFGNFNTEIIVIGAFFLIFFAFIYIILSRILKDQYGNTNKMFVGIIAFCSATLIVYFGGDFLNRTIYGLNLSENLINWLIAGVFIVFAIWIINKMGFGRFLLVLGAGLIIVGFTDLVYRKGALIIFGAVLVMVGIFISKKRKPKSFDSDSQSNYPTDYTNKIREMRERQQYEYYRRREKEMATQERAQRRNRDRAERLQAIRDKKIKKKFIGRYGERAWKRRGGN